MSNESATNHSNNFTYVGFQCRCNIDVRFAFEWNQKVIHVLPLLSPHISCNIMLLPFIYFLYGYHKIGNDNSK